MTQRGLPLITDYADDWETDRFVDEIIKAGATAVITYDYMLAIMLMDEFRNRGIAVPGDISLMAFNILAPRVFGPSLTSMQQPLEEMGNAAANILYRKINGEEADDQLVFPFTLRDNGTTPPPPKSTQANDRI
jgi:DNA-binding LacI/PurR family transcriptional regulator